MSTNDSRLGSQLFQTIAKPFKTFPMLRQEGVQVRTLL